jgi:tRNA dimethylallyltransferase
MRVDYRIKAGIFGEAERLLGEGINWDNQSMDSLGYKHYKKYLRGEFGMEEFRKKWEGDEFKYAKRQMTWFRKNKEVVWFDCIQSGLPKRCRKISSSVVFLVCEGK